MAESERGQVRIALVTGAGSGIGRHAAIAMMGRGMNVALMGRRVEALEETAQLGSRQASPTGAALGAALVVPGSVTDETAVADCFRAVTERFGRLDVLFNNAGINVPGTPIEDLTLDAWQSVVDTNLTGMFLCTREAVRVMKSQSPQGGRIINNGSVSATAPRPDSTVYTATKHAVTGLSKSTELDGRKYNITCGQIDIGNALTEMAAKMTGGVPQANGEIRPEPTMDVQHVADAVAQMAMLPLDVNVPFMTIMASKMPLWGRG